ncbi:hypothetical protein L195_g015173 [Trifolium pratense]|uniref:Putative reverse transcriptase n=1 Tax=Trifolium pratense TaxID=57577 RepID=A0A2K3MMK9_TRIPR|nr:putative reverse transcriptase [Trifolium pratense]PNX92043.1 hypothetical protein L195_g015173 [Trifolium pratense]
MLIHVPSREEIKDVVFTMNGDGAPGPDGFSGQFYQCYCHIVASDVVNSVQHFSLHGKLLHNMNSNLLIMGHVQLVKSIIHGMLIYSFHVYLWPKNILKKLDTWIRNFVWSGDINTKKICTVAWKKVCNPYAAGGLDLRPLSNINVSLMLLLCWKLLSSQDQWALLCRARYIKDGIRTRSFLNSSIWHGMKPHFTTAVNHSIWLIGNGESISYWNDNWLGKPLVDLLQLPGSIAKRMHSSVADMIAE